MIKDRFFASVIANCFSERFFACDYFFRSGMNAPPKWELFDQEGEKKYV
jgi:hypothetical protein